MEATRPAPGLNQLGRYLAALFGAIALVCFYQPWVAGNLPSVGNSTLTGIAIARGEASQRVDTASFGNLGASAALPGSAGSTSSGAASAPTLAAGSNVGGLTLPTRVPTVGAGTTSGFSGGAAPTVAPAASGAGSAAVAPGSNVGGLTLPTRVPTVAAGSSAGSSGFSAPPAAATSLPNLEIGRQVERKEPDRLPQSPLYGIPLAAAGLAIFSLIWDRLGDPRDQKYGKWWTILLSAGGTLGVGYVLFKVATAPATNDLLSPGKVTGTLWGLWGTFLAFLLSAICLAIAWTAPSGRRAAVV